jgi:hypothetical protein
VDVKDDALTFAFESITPEALEALKKKGKKPAQSLH